MLYDSISDIPDHLVIAAARLSMMMESVHDPQPGVDYGSLSDKDCIIGSLESGADMKASGKWDDSDQAIYDRMVQVLEGMD